MRAHANLKRNAWGGVLAIVAIGLMKTKIWILQVIGIALIGAGLLIVFAPLLDSVAVLIGARGKNRPEGDAGNKRR